MSVLSSKPAWPNISLKFAARTSYKKVLNDTVNADIDALKLTQSLYDTGINNQISVVQAQSALQSAQASATNVALLRAQYEHAIAMLIGKPASDFSIPVKPMTTAPPAIPIGLPSQLLQRRPDIAAAERNMASANAAIWRGLRCLLPDRDVGRWREDRKLILEASFRHTQPFLVGWAYGLADPLQRRARSGSEPVRRLITPMSPPIARRF